MQFLNRKKLNYLNRKESYSITEERWLKLKIDEK